MHNTYAIFWTQNRLNSVERIFHNRDSYNEAELFSLVPNHGLFSGSSGVTIQVKVALWYTDKQIVMLALDKFLQGPVFLQKLRILLTLLKVPGFNNHLYSISRIIDRLGLFVFLLNKTAMSKQL